VPKKQTLLVAFIVGVAAMVLFAFTLVGLAGEAIAALALLGLGLRATCAVVARVRRVPHC
jgi:hypothetical protein